MKIFVKRFLHKGLKMTDPSNEGISYNAFRANKKLDMPISLYLLYAYKFPCSKLRKDLKKDVETAFCAGLVCGWAEKNKKIK